MLMNIVRRYIQPKEIMINEMMVMKYNSALSQDSSVRVRYKDDNYAITRVDVDKLSAMSGIHLQRIMRDLIYRIEAVEKRRTGRRDYIDEHKFVAQFLETTLKLPAIPGTYR